MGITCNGTWEESNPDACLRVRRGGVQPTNIHYHGISINKSFLSLRWRLPQELTSSRQGQYYCKIWFRIYKVQILWYHSYSNYQAWQSRLRKAFCQRCLRQLVPAMKNFLFCSGIRLFAIFQRLTFTKRENCGFEFSDFSTPFSLQSFRGGLLHI